MNPTTKILAFTGLCVLVSTCLAQSNCTIEVGNKVIPAYCPPTGASADNFVTIAPGIVKDQRTGLEWMRCNLGQIWSEAAQTCQGSAKIYSFAKAQTAVKQYNATHHSHWRLPSVTELASLRVCSAGFDEVKDFSGGIELPEMCKTGSTSPTMAVAIFPPVNQPVNWATHSYAVEFTDGLINNFSGSHGFIEAQVRLVRKPK
jgi:hypothetical protein